MKSAQPPSPCTSDTDVYGANVQAALPSQAAELPQLPPAFLELLETLVPAAAQAAVAASYTQAKPVHFRLNPLSAAPEATLAELLQLAQEEPVRQALAGLQAVPGFPLTYRLPAAARQALTHSAAATAGRLYVQGLASMAAVLALAPQPDEEILDLAAAPGGKTSLIAVAMHNSGRLAAVEAVKPRYYKLKANLQRLGVTNAHCYLKDGVLVGRLTPERFDRVLLDAPCSSEARFSRLDPSTWAHWSPRKVREMARKQGKLMRSAIAALKPGGTLVYCTCALSPEENELILAEALRHHPELALTALELPPLLPALPGLTTWRGQALDPQLALARRLLPGPESDAFFIARLYKQA